MNPFADFEQHAMELARNFIDYFDGLFPYIIAYFACVIIFSIIGGKLWRQTFLYPFVTLALTVYNPLVIIPLAEIIGLDVRIRRIFWLLPVEVVLALAGAFIIGKIQWKALKFLAFAAMILLIAIGGKSILYEYHPASNVYKMDSDAMVLTQAIEADAGIERGGEGLVMTASASPEVMEMRIYDPCILNVLSRKDVLYWKPGNIDKEKLDLILSKNDPKKTVQLVIRFGLKIEGGTFRAAVDQLGISYLISNKCFELDEYMTGMGYPLLAESGDFVVYKTSSPAFQ